MNTFWLTYKPLAPRSPRGWPIEELRNLISKVYSDPENATIWWRMVSHKKAKVGDRVYLFKQGADPRGLIGFGSIIGRPAKKAEASDGDEPKWRAQVRFDRLVDPTAEFLLPLKDVRECVPETLITAMGSGQSVSDEACKLLDKHLGPTCQKAQ